MMRFLTLVICCGQVLLFTEAYPEGAPAKTCMEGGFPHHHGVEPQLSPGPFVIEVNSTQYDPGDVIEVVLKVKEDGATFKGFQLHAQRIRGDTEEVIGRFVNVPDDAQAQSWYHDDLTQENCVTHNSNDDKTEIKVLWQAPPTSQGDVIFRSSFLFEFDLFWMDIKSPVIQAKQADQSAPYASLVDVSVPQSLDVSAECGVTRGCFLYPPGCSAQEHCDYIVAYHFMAGEETIHFHIVGGTDDYVAIGFSHDDDMVDDETYHCLERDSVAALYHGYSPKMFNNRHRLTGVTDVTVGRVDGRIKCGFVLPINGTVHFYDHEEGLTTRKVFNLNDDWYLQVAWGDIYEGTDVPKKHSGLPLTSSKKLKFTQFQTVSGTQISLDLKLHAIFGLLAWFVSAGLGMILARHYRQELKRPLLQLAMWFQFHRSCMLVTFLTSVAGIIIMFVHEGGWVKSKEAETHAILGLVAASLGLINILGGFLRPGLTSSKRPLFNWGHRLGAVSAVTLAAVCAFLGVNFSFFEAEFSRRMTITLAVWVVVQLTWEVVLEVVTFVQTRDQEANKNKDNLEMKEPGSDDTRQRVSVKLICLLLYCLCQVCFFAAAFSFLV